MTLPSSRLKDDGHFFVVAGYPTLGKSNLLWKAARTGLPLFGKDHGPIVPCAEALQGIDEQSDTMTKLAAGFWLTLADIPRLNEEPSLPDKLILHLDLLLAHLLYRTDGNSASDISGIEAAFECLFGQLALRPYGKCTVTTLHAPIEEVQRRWRHRYPAGLPANCSPIITAKDALINDEAVAAPLYAAIYRAWAGCLKSLADRGTLAGHLQLGSRIRSDARQVG